MDVEKISDNGQILRIKVGSHLYGTNTSKSDVDYSGVFIANEDVYFGLNNIEEIDLSTKSKSQNGKNLPDAVDYKLYELKNFARLAMQNNPNILEHLFVSDSNNIMFINDFGRILIDNRHLFPYKGAYDRFMGYSNSQRHKMVIKEINYTSLADAYNYFCEQESHAYLIEYRDKNLKFMNENDSYFTIGDLSLQKNLKVKKVISMIGDRLSKISNRYELVLNYGYDTKFASHLIRLLLEGEELLLTGELVFPLSEASLILDIKSGKYSIEEILLMSTEIENRMRDAKERSILPASPNFKKINELIKSMIKEHLLNVTKGN